MSEPLNEPDSRISLLNYFNNPKNTDEQYFIGRKKELDKLVDFLTRNKGGSYLVSGYRGVGKTRFVNHALKQYKRTKTEREQKKVIEVRINLGSDSKLSSRTVLIDIVSLFKESIEEKLKRIKLYSSKINSFPLSPFTLLSIFFISIVISGIFSSGAIGHFINAKDPDFFVFIESLSIPAKVSLSILIISVLALIISIYGLIIRKCYSNFLAPLSDLTALQKAIYLSTENNISVGNHSIGNVGRKEFATVLDNNQIESKLIKIFTDITNDSGKGLEVVIIFDELDKLTGRVLERTEGNIDLIKESKLRKSQIDSLLGDLKNFITASRVTYIFIAGRDMYDAYLSERGSANSLYESLFNDHIYIPSLLTDRSDEEVYVLDSMIEAFVVSNLITKDQLESGWKIQNKEDFSINSYLQYLKLSTYARLLEREVEEKERIKVIHNLKILIHFLALHSWGNYKRLITLFESFVRLNPDINSNRYELYFSTKDIQRLVLASHLYIMFHHNLSRMLINADDKLVVSSFSVFLHTMKYHGIGFSRENILRMYETINIHSSPELIRVVDIILNNVLSNHIRIIRRSGIYRYRFSYLHEREIHFITNINEDESAAFNFSLNAMDAVKQHYRNLIVDSKYTHADEGYGHIALASIHIIVGDFHFWEQAYDEASIHYGMASDILEKNYYTKLDNSTLENKNPIILQLIEVYLKQGSVAERIGNYGKAESIYNEAARKSDEYFIKIRKEDREENPEWGILLQPRWAKSYLQLKHSSFNYISPKSITTNSSKYKEAVLLFFMGKFTQAHSGFMQVCSDISQQDPQSFFLLGNSYLRAAFSLFLNFSIKLHKKNINFDLIDDQFETLLQNTIISLDQAISGFKQIADDFLDNEAAKKLTEFEKAVLNKHRSKINFPNNSIYHENDTEEIQLAFGLLRLSTFYFIKGRLNLDAAIASLSTVMMWEVFLEMLPWQKIENININKNLSNLKNNIKKIRNSPKNLIIASQEQAFTSIAYSTGNAFSHFMKTSMHRNLQKSLPNSLFGEGSIRKSILDERYFDGHGLYQQNSIFGQVAVASIYWEEIAYKRFENSNFKEIENLRDGYLLPYGVRYYTTTLWLRGRLFLNEVLNSEFDDCPIFDKEDKPNEDAIVLNNKLISAAMNALILFFRSSQYVIKTHGDASGMGIPPLHMIYYNFYIDCFLYIRKITIDLLIIRKHLFI